VVFIVIEAGKAEELSIDPSIYEPEHHMASM